MIRSLFILYLLLFFITPKTTFAQPNQLEPISTELAVQPAAQDSLQQPPKVAKTNRKKVNTAAIVVGSSVLLTRLVFHIRWLIIKEREE